MYVYTEVMYKNCNLVNCIKTGRRKQRKFHSFVLIKG